MVRWTLFPIFLEQGLLIDDLKEGTILRHARQPKEKSSSPTGFVWITNMAAMTSCEYSLPGPDACDHINPLHYSCEPSKKKPGPCYDQ